MLLLQDWHNKKFDLFAFESNASIGIAPIAIIQSYTCRATVTGNIVAFKVNTAKLNQIG